MPVVEVGKSSTAKLIALKPLCLSIMFSKTESQEHLANLSPKSVSQESSIPRVSDKSVVHDCHTSYNRRPLKSVFQDSQQIKGVRSKCSMDWSVLRDWKAPQRHVFCFRKDSQLSMSCFVRVCGSHWFLHVSTQQFLN